MVRSRFATLGLLWMALSCSRKVERTEHRAVASAARSATKPSPAPTPPTRLTTLPISAYAATLAFDGDAIFLLTSKAAYRFASGEPDHGLALDLGVGPALTRSAFVFWSSGAIWSTPKQGGVPRKLAALPHQPQYFVASGDEFAWVDLSDVGLYTIQILEKQEPRVLVLSAGEISGLNMVGDSIYFVQRPTDDTWRIGLVRTHGGEVEYSGTKKGRRPAMLSGGDQIYYYSLDTSEIRALSLDLGREQVTMRDVVCSPIQVSTAIYCGCVEGLFTVSRETGLPRILVQDRPGSITTIAANEKQVAWIVDAGPDLLAVDVLRLPGTR